MEIQSSNYCKSGIGRDINDPACFACQKECSPRRVISGGPNIGSEITKAQSRPSGPYLVIPDSVTSKEKLSEYLQQLGYKRGTDAYWNFYKELSGNFQREKH